MRVSFPPRPELPASQPLGALPADAARVQKLRDTRDAQQRAGEDEREPERSGLPTTQTGDAAPGEGEAPKRPDEIARMVESRISNARLSPEQKELLRKFAAVSLKRTADLKDLPRVVKGVLALVEAWESLNRGKTVSKEDPRRVKRVAEQLDELQEVERAAGEIPGAEGDADPDELPGMRAREASETRARDGSERRVRDASGMRAGGGAERRAREASEMRTGGSEARDELPPGMVPGAPPGVLVDILV